MTANLAGAADVGESWGSAKDTFTIEKGVYFGGERAEIRQYVWNHSTDDTRVPSNYFLGLALTPRPGPTRAAYLDADRPVSGGMGKICFIPPGRTLRSGGGPGTLRALECTLSTAMVDDLLPRPPTWRADDLIKGLHLRDLEIEWLLFKVYRELHQGGFATKTMVEALATALAVALVRHFGLEQEEAGPVAGGLAPWRMRRIRERIYADRPAPGLAELADLCGLSVRHLSRSFKAETGRTIAKYVEEVTVERARELLNAGDLPIAQIARYLGFSSSANFAYAFRRATGMRPSEIYGKRQRANWH